MSGLKRLYRALGPAWSAALGVALAAGVAAVVAVAATGSGSARRRPAASVASVPTGASPPRLAVQRPASASKHGRAKAHKRPGTHRPGKAKTHTTSTPTTTTSTTTTATTTASPAPTTTSPSGPLTVDLHGGGDAMVSACGETHHYRTYAAGTTIAYTGTVSPIPQARWKVKLQIKICAGGTYIDVMKLDATRNKHTGAFSGTFTALPGGLYYARAELYVNDSEISDSDKVHFKTH
jgi:hypothetical protein